MTGGVCPELRTQAFEVLLFWRERPPEGEKPKKEEREGKISMNCKFKPRNQTVEIRSDAWVHSSRSLFYGLFLALGNYSPFIHLFARFPGRPLGNGLRRPLLVYICVVAGASQVARKGNGLGGPLLVYICVAAGASRAALWEMVPKGQILYTFALRRYLPDEGWHGQGHLEAFGTRLVAN